MSASSVTKKAASFVVAASMSVVEALKDQAGLCRWDYAIRSLYNRAAAAKVTGRAVPVSLSSSQTAGCSSAAAARAGARTRRMEEEKLSKAYHLVCWGPN
ncbi:hypothetical protein PAHAL_4G039900 [Panicum hallii]|jgi:hypothetical protein|uniref:Wound-responsive family protein n=1 Tax=Panicum hallii TaxID=206008 RepID=A0A2S3HGY4_9POAL|nr:uncharacterized protein LOC112889759 [Panicum hallii]PAN22714.1 hypothetical protein PAHAL_4G039900 [Panicum hallii]